ncbi:MAG: hypothetical protein R3C03_10040 [Pirellulaceae bacterium]
MKTISIETVIFFVLTSVSFIGCDAGESRLPPRPLSISGETDQNQHYAFLAWQDGLRLLVIDNFVGPATRKSDFKLGDGRPYVFAESAKTEAIVMSWSIETTDGKTGKFILDDRLQDLTKGTVFVARQNANGFTLKQIRSDELSTIEPTKEAIGPFVSRITGKSTD